MKIFTDACVYVQKNDIAILNRYYNKPIPTSIYMKIFGDGIVVIDDRNRYEFIKFEENEEIEFFKNLDWIIDINDYKNKEEIIECGQKTAEERNRLARKYNLMSNKDQEANDIYIQCELLHYKMFSLRDFLWLLEGDLSYSLSWYCTSIFM